MILHIFMNLTWYVTFRMVWNCPICSRSWKLEVHTWKIAFRGLLFAQTSYMKTKYRLWFYIFLRILRGMSRSVWFGIARFIADLNLKSVNVTRCLLIFKTQNYTEIYILHTFRYPTVCDSGMLVLNLWSSIQKLRFWPKIIKIW